MRDLAALAESFLAFCDAFGIGLYDWQRAAFGEAVRREAGRFVHPLGGISVPRGNGKSFGGAAVGVWRLLCGPPPQLLLSAALDCEGARVIPDLAKRIVQRHPALEAAVEVRADSILVPSTGSRWLIRSREHTASRGLHPDVVLYDEVGWARDDELFASLLAAQASVVAPLLLVVSTVGRRKTGPLWTIKVLSEDAAEASTA